MRRMPMHRRLLLLVAGVAAVPLLAGCAATQSTDEAEETSTPPEPTASPSVEQSAASAPEDIRIRFRVGDAEILVVPADNPTARAFVATLPLTLEFEEFAGNEKISYLPSRLDTTGSPGSQPAVGDLSYYVPWGNIAFFYVPGTAFSDQVIPIGSIESGAEHIPALETGTVTVDITP